MTEIVCPKTGQSYTVSENEIKLLYDISPVLEGKKYIIPPSKFHPDVHHQRHLARRNERSFYKTTCALTGKSIITNVNPSQGYTIYNFKDWWSDKRDAQTYGIDIDVNKSFTQQFGELFFSVPHMSLSVNTTNQNCDYCNYGLNAKSCYMSSSAGRSEQAYYSDLTVRCYYDVDGYGNTDSRYCYACRYARNCYKCQYVIYSNDCRSCKYMLDCRDCEYCFGCVNLLHKKYCIWNVQYEKNVYLELIAELEKESSNTLLQRFVAFSLTLPKRATRGAQNEGSTGDLNFHTKNCINCFNTLDAKDCINVWAGGIGSNDLINYTIGAMNSMLHSSTGMTWSHASAFSLGTQHAYQCFYCYYCIDCEFCFGCIRLYHKKYCIFNKQYTKEDYEKKLSELITKMTETGEWGEFFHPSLSPYPYNDSNAQEWFPEAQEDIKQRGRKFIEKEIKSPQIGTYRIEPIEIYKNNPEKRNQLLNSTLICSVTGDAYKIIEQELDFYIKFNIQIPTKHYLQRYKERCALRRMPRKLYARTCAKTGVDILTSYAPDRPEIVWVEDVWDQEFS